MNRKNVFIISLTTLLACSGCSVKQTTSDGFTTLFNGKNFDGWLHYASPTDNHNSLNDQWNNCEVIVMGGDYVIHKLNGEVVNAAFNIFPSKGIIGFKGETAEIFYRNIRIKEFQKSVPVEEFL